MKLTVVWLLRRLATFFSAAWLRKVIVDRRSCVLKRRTIISTLVIFCFAAPAFSQVAPGRESKIKIDPAMFVELKESRNIMRAVGDQIWKGWDPSKTPILFYRPGVQDILIGYPHLPAGFQVLTGFNPLPGETIYYRDDKTFIEADGQNTSTDIDGVPTLVVADTFSNQRTQIQGAILARDVAFLQEWLKEWNFLPNNPYDQIAMILHEAFHCYQNVLAPDKGPNEMAAVNYPLLDVSNNSYWSLEAAIVKDALTSDARERKIDKIKELVAVRSERRAALKKDAIEYEDQAEYLEGLAKYIEYRFLIKAQGLEPQPELFFLNGFHGYGEHLKRVLADRYKQMKDIIAASIDMTGNKFGVGPLRFRLYSSGAALALLLDEVDPGWKADIFKDGVYLFDKLQRAVPFGQEERSSLIARAKSEYAFEDLKKEKIQFENEGRKVLDGQLKSILETKDTLVVIDYSELGGIAGMAFTPFGVTRISDNQIIYGMVPVAVKFKGKGEFKFSQVVPVLIDKSKKEMSFAVKTDPAKLTNKKGDELVVDEFTLKGCGFSVASAANKVRIKLLK